MLKGICACHPKLFSHEERKNRWMSEQEWMWKMRHLSMSLTVTVRREKNKSHNSFHWRMNSHIIVWSEGIFALLYHDLTHGFMTMLFIESGRKSISLTKKREIFLAWYRKGISILIQDKNFLFHSGGNKKIGFVIFFYSHSFDVCL